MYIVKLDISWFILVLLLVFSGNSSIVSVPLREPGETEIVSDVRSFFWFMGFCEKNLVSDESEILVFCVPTRKD